MIEHRPTLRDDPWKHIQALLPGRLGHVGVMARDNRLCVAITLATHGATCPSGVGSFGGVHTR